MKSLQEIMGKRVFGVSGVIVAFVMFSGCDLTEQDVTADVVSEANLCGEIAEVMCANIFQCCTGVEIEYMFGDELTNTESECQYDLRLYCERRLSWLVFAVENDTASLKVSAINHCLATSLAPVNVCFETEMNPAWINACEDIDFVSGNQEEGDGCFWDLECETNSYCANDMTCKALSGLNEDCYYISCATPYYCAADPFSSDYTCEEYRQLGDSCSPDSSDGMMCETETLHCQDGACATKLPLGESCGSNAACESGECAPGHCDNSPWRSCYDNDDCYKGDTCIGEIVCVDTPSLTDYCDIGVGLLSLFPEQASPWDEWK